MKNKQMIVALMAGSLSLATSLKAADPPDPAPAPAPPDQARPSQPGQSKEAPRRAEMAPEHQHPYLGYLGASHIVGREVRNDVGEYLGTVQDLIVNLDSDTARFAIIKYGGTLGIGGTRVAVPLKDLKWTADTKEFLMPATKEQIQSASPTPMGGWAFAANQDWASKVDRFYGDPGKFDVSELARPALSEPGDSREFVRDTAQPGPAIPEPAIGPENQPPQLPTADLGPKMLASTLADGDLLVKINQLIEQYAGPAAGGNVQAAVQKGVVTLTGKVSAATQKQDLETRIKGLDGVVTLIDDQLVATNE
ncbi:MAG: PRC-barrel domain-containing protein [Verrucomicrobiota bacterium]